MSRNRVHIVIIVLSILFFAGCGQKTSGKEQHPVQPLEEASSLLYENDERGIRVQESDGWFVEKETETTVKFKNDRVVAVISVVPKEKTTSEIKKELLAGAGEVTIIGEGIDFIIWKTERAESIRSEIHVVEGIQHNYIITLMTPLDLYEEKQELVKAFKYQIDFY